MEISTKNKSEKEEAMVSLVQQLEKEYDFPIFTEKILVEEGSVPHAYPILTLNTRVSDPREVLSTLIHEQLHWFAQDNPRHKEAMDYLKQHYEDNGECNKSGTYPDSFWEHIIVCWNTRNILQQLLPEEDIQYVYSQWQAYPKTEKLVADNFTKIEKELTNLDMIAPAGRF